VFCPVGELQGGLGFGEIVGGGGDAGEEGDGGLATGLEEGVF